MPTTRRVFNRIPSPPSQSHLYNVRAVTDRTRPRNYTWPLKISLNQGNAGYCVGFAWEHEGGALPKAVKGISNAGAISLFKIARRSYDDRPLDNDDTDDGTYVLAGAKAAKQLGRLLEYRWATNVIDALVAISRIGPAVLGLEWRAGMMDTDHNGFIHATGEVVGGHAILARGVKIVWKAGTKLWNRLGSDWWSYVDLDKSYLVLHNSWGPLWGGTEHGPGTAKLSVRDFAMLLGRDGEVCIPTMRPDLVAA